MDDEPTTSDDDGRVSVTKPAKSAPAGSAPARPAAGLAKLFGGPSLATDGSPMPPPPKQVRNAALAIAVSGVAALAAALSLFGEKSWLRREALKSNAKLKPKDRKSRDEVLHIVNATVGSHLTATIVLLVALAFVTRGVLRGRSWARWGVIGLWVLATLTGAFSGFTYLLGIVSDEPLPFKVPSFVSAAAFIVAVVLVSIRPSAAYFARTRPARPGAAGAAGGAPARRPGLFGPRAARPGFSAPAGGRTTAAARPARAPARDGVERSRAKQRASTESVAKGAELARARAKASKSRRSGV